MPITIERKIRAHLAGQPSATARELARALGVSRQRIYQALRRYGIQLSSVAVAASNIEARMVTGGIPAKITHSIAGSICELLVAADLLARGYKAYVPIIGNRSHDIIAVAPNGKILTIEVRSGTRSQKGVRMWAKHRTASSEYFAVVIKGEPVHYSPPLPE